MQRNPVIGFLESYQGVQGKSVKLDGYLSRIESDPIHINGNTGFSIEAWVALQAYPWNRSPIINQGNNSLHHQPLNDCSDFFFGVDASGHLVFDLRLNDSVYSCESFEALEALKWHHISATYDAECGIHLYINGKMVGHIKTGGVIGPLNGRDLWLGMNLERMGPLGSERKASADIGSKMVLHGLLDEVKLYGRALEEAQQKVGDFSDILVHFDQSPVRFLFWRGTGYGGIWVTENGIWMGDQSLERANAGKSPMGCVRQ